MEIVDGLSDYEELHWQEYPILREYAKKAGWNESEANSSFSPYIAWHFPALVEKVEIAEDDSDWWKNTVYFTFRVLILSPVSLNSVEIVYSDSATSTYTTNLGAGEHWVEHTFSGNYLYVKSLGYRLGVKAEDGEGNKLEFSKSFGGLFSGVLDFLADIWSGIVAEFHSAMKAVQAAVNYIVKWIVDLLKEAVNKVIDGIKSLISGKVKSLGEAIKGMISGGNVRAMDVVISVMGIMQIVRIEESIENAVIVIDTGAVAAETAGEAYSGGIMSLIKDVIVKVAKNLVEKKLIVGIALTEFTAQFSEVLKALVSGAEDEAMEKIKSALGLGDKFVDMLKNLGKILEREGSKKEMRKYYFGFSMAMLGFLTSLISKAMRFKGNAKIGADIIMVGVAFSGFFTFNQESNSPRQGWRKVIASLVTNIEFLIALAGFSSALFDLTWDLKHGGE